MVSWLFSVSFVPLREAEFNLYYPFSILYFPFLDKNQGKKLLFPVLWRHGQVVRQGPAKPLSLVRIQVAPPYKIAGPMAGFFRGITIEKRLRIDTQTFNPQL